MGKEPSASEITYWQDFILSEEKEGRKQRGRVYAFDRGNHSRPAQRYLDLKPE
jgi:hypothetical protein